MLRSPMCDGQRSRSLCRSPPLSNKLSPKEKHLIKQKQYMVKITIKAVGNSFSSCTWGDEIIKKIECERMGARRAAAIFLLHSEIAFNI